MRKTIWKFELETTDNQEIKMPVGAEILTVQVQGETLCLWALVDPSAEKETRHFEMIGTGHPINYNTGVSRVYIGSYQLLGGELVFHVFEPTP